MTAPTLGSPLPRYAAAAPQALGTAGRAAAGATPRALVVALAAFLVVNVARTHEIVPQLSVLRLGKLSGVPLVILALSRLPRWQIREALRTGPGRGVLFIGLMMILSVPLSIWPGNSFGYIKSTGLISYIMFVAAASVLVDRAAALTILRTVIAAVALDATRMLLPGAPVYMEGGVPRALFGYTYDPNDTAALFLVSVPLALYLGNRRGARWWLWYGAALLMVVGLVRTGSRGGLIGLIAMVAALIVLATPRQRTRLISAALAASVAFGALVSSNDELRTRFASTFDSSETDYNYTAANGRLELWKRGIHYMVTHPVTGVGIANFPTAELLIGSEIKREQGIYSRHMFTAHNSLVQIGAELGIPGLLAYIAVVFTAFVGLWRIRRDAVAIARAGLNGANDVGALAAAVMTSLTGAFVGGLFLSLAYSPMTMFTFALCAGIIAGAPVTLALPAAGGRTVPPSPARPTGRRGGLRRTPTPSAVGVVRSI